MSMNILEEKLLKSTTYSIKFKGMPSYEALNTIEKELTDDGLTAYDLGSYTTVEMLPEADFMIQQLMGKNLVNQNEYHKTTEIHKKLINFFGDFLNIPNVNTVFGSSTSGSSEAIFLALLGAKWYWKRLGYSEKPNIVLCKNAHLSWYKFAQYLDIDIREVTLKEINRYPFKKILNAVNQNTLFVVAILGCTYFGQCDPIHKLHISLEKLNTENNWDVGIHVDAAIGGFIMPFLKEQSNTDWDFKLPLVRSINLSSHKYGLVYPGLGWILFRDNKYFPKELITNSPYLTGVFESFTVSFSRPSSLVIAQYFNLLHYGFEGYLKTVEKCKNHAELLSNLITATGFFQIISKTALPIVVFKFKEAPNFDEEAFTKLLRTKKWMLPYYTLPHKKGTKVMRVVVKKDLTLVAIKLLVNDLANCYQTLENRYKNQKR